MRAVRRGALGIAGAGLLLASFAGCASSPEATSSSGAARPDTGDQKTAAAPADQARNAAPPGGSATGENVQSLDKPPSETGRKIVSTATLTVQVDDVIA